MRPERTIAVVGPTYLDQTIRVDGVLSLDGSRRIVEEYSSIGGTGLCYAIALARQGNRVELYSALGTDVAADEIMEAVTAEPGLSAQWQQLPGKTDHAVIFVDGGNHKCVASQKERSDHWVPDDEFLAGVADKDAIVFTSFANRITLGAIQRLIHMRQTAKPYIMWAPHHGNAEDARTLLPVLPYIDHITLSAEEYVALYDAIGDPRDHGVHSVTVTAGKDGASLLRLGQPTTLVEPILQIHNPLDTNGAGEAFGSGFLTALMHTRDHERATLVGSYIGGLHVNRRGSDFPRVHVSSYIVRTALFDNEQCRSNLREELAAC